MKQESQFVLVWVLVLLAIAVLAIFYFANPFQMGALETPTGGTILSADKMMIQSNNSDLGGKDALIILASASGLGQYASGEFTPSDVNLLAGRPSKETFKIILNLVGQDCVYDVQETDEIIYALGAITAWDPYCSYCQANLVGQWGCSGGGRGDWGWCGV